jgi:hypothetical protein
MSHRYTIYALGALGVRRPEKRTKRPKLRSLFRVPFCITSFTENFVENNFLLSILFAEVDLIF